VPPEAQSVQNLLNRGDLFRLCRRPLSVPESILIRVPPRIAIERPNALPGGSTHNRQPWQLQSEETFYVRREEKVLPSFAPEVVMRGRGYGGLFFGFDT